MVEGGGKGWRKAELASFESTGVRDGKAFAGSKACGWPWHQPAAPPWDACPGPPVGVIWVALVGCGSC